MKRRYTAKGLLCFLICAVLAFPGLLLAEGEEKYTESGQFIGPGTYYKNAVWQTKDRICNINMIETLIGTNYLKVEISDSGKAVGVQNILEQAKQKESANKRVIASVNGDFFYTNYLRGLPTGTSIIDGEIRTAVPSSTVFGVTDKGNCFIDTLTMNGFVNYKGSNHEIKGVNRVRWNNEMILYTPAFGQTTYTMGVGTEVIVKNIENPIKGNQVYKGTVYKVQKDVKGTQIPQDGVVISAQGTAAQLLSGVSEGDEISFVIYFNRPNVKYAVSGSPRLLENGRISEDISKRNDAKVRHPRTAVGIKGGRVVVFTVDGRQEGFSEGMTLYEVAEYLKRNGVENAINLDGGGSTTMIARKQGDYSADLINSPSDGRMRAVSNSIQIISEAPLSEPAFIRFNDSSIKIYKNSSYKPEFYAMDKYLNRVDVKREKIKFATNTKTGKITADGVYTAGSKAGGSYIDVSAGKAKKRLALEIVDKISTLQIDTDYVNLDPGQKQQLGLRAFDENGNEIIISPNAVKWTVSGGVGKIDSKGLYTAGSKNAAGKIIVQAGKTIAQIDAKVGLDPIIVSHFDNVDNFEAKSLGGSALITQSAEGEPVKSGKASIKLQYEFTKEDDETSVAYINMKEPLKVLGKPAEIGMWVYGDGAGHWMRGIYTNAKGERKVVNFTEYGGLDFKGWKYVWAEISKEEHFPIKINQIYVAEPVKEKKNKGVIYIDQLTSIYKFEKDIYNPQVVAVNPAEGVSSDLPVNEISIIVKDKGKGIDTKSIKLLLNEASVPVFYDEKTGGIVYKPAQPLTAGEYRIRLQLKDKAGNSLNPEFASKFTVK